MQTAVKGLATCGCDNFVIEGVYVNSCARRTWAMREYGPLCSDIDNELYKEDCFVWVLRKNDTCRS